MPAGISSADVERVLSTFKPGARVFVQGAIGEPTALRGLLERYPSAADGVTFTGCFIPGINDYDYGALHPNARITSFFASPSLRRASRAQQLDLRPLSYSAIAAWLQHRSEFDLAVLQVAPPDAYGHCSFGPSQDFAPLVWRRAKQRLVFINPLMPVPKRGTSLPFDARDIAIECAAPLIEAPAASNQSETAASIAALAASLISDGARIQIGIGSLPKRVLAALTNHRGIILRSGIVTPEFELLLSCGAAKTGAAHHAGFAYGDMPFYKSICRNDAFAFADVSATHSALALAQTPRFFAINSALQVDLFGQANLEFTSAGAISGVGGAPEFMRAASRGHDGLAILVLPACARDGSRIVARLAGPAVSLPRGDVDVVVTEFGTAILRDRSLDARAEALIAIAAPQFRDELYAKWRGLRATI